METSESAPRLTPDEWEIAIFGGDDPTRWRSKNRTGQRDGIEGKLVEAGMRAARLGINVVFDFGFWGKDERSALRWIPPVPAEHATWWHWASERWPSLPAPDEPAT